MFKKKEMGEFHTKDFYKVLDVYNYQVNKKKREGGVSYTINSLPIIPVYRLDV